MDLFNLLLIRLRQGLICTVYISQKFLDLFQSLVGQLDLKLYTYVIINRQKLNLTIIKISCTFSGDLGIIQRIFGHLEKSSVHSTFPSNYFWMSLNGYQRVDEISMCPDFKTTCLCTLVSVFHPAHIPPLECHF